MDFFELANNRYSERFFDRRPVEQEKLDKILEAGRIVPTACNYQPQKFYVIRSKEAMTMMYEAEELGVHTIWIRGFDSKSVVDTFGLPEYMIPVMMLGLGYPNEKAKPNGWHFKRKPIEDFVTEL